MHNLVMRISCDVIFNSHVLEDMVCKKMPKERHATGSENVHHILLAWFGVPV